VNRRWRTAVHEAGHGTAVVVLGGRVRQVSVRRSGNSSGRCWAADLLPAWESAIVSLAGPAAELFVEADPSDAHKAHVLASADEDDFDFPVAQRLADEGGFSYEEAGEAAALLVLEHWPAIEAVARALRGSRRGLVSGERVAGIVRSSPQRPAALPVQPT
jgi:hypothetical protein